MKKAHERVKKMFGGDLISAVASASDPAAAVEICARKSIPGAPVKRA